MNCIVFLQVFFLSTTLIASTLKKPSRSFFTIFQIPVFLVKHLLPSLHCKRERVNQIQKKTGISADEDSPVINCP